MARERSATARSRATKQERQQDMLAQVLAGLQDLSARMSAQDERLSRLETATPRFRPVDATEYEKPQKYVQTGPDRVISPAQVPVGKDGLRIPQHLLRQFPPRFRRDDAVRLNPESPIHGGDGRTWGQVLGDRQPVGKIVKLMYPDRDNEWKYGVRIPGVTRGPSTGFRESELSPA